MTWLPLPTLHQSSWWPKRSPLVNFKGCSLGKVCFLLVLCCWPCWPHSFFGNFPRTIPAHLAYPMPAQIQHCTFWSLCICGVRFFDLLTGWQVLAGRLWGKFILVGCRLFYPWRWGSVLRDLTKHPQLLKQLITEIKEVAFSLLFRLCQEQLNALKVVQHLAWSATVKK